MSFDYVPFSEKQLAIIQDPLDSRITVAEGAVRSGKTIAVGVRWLLYVLMETSANAKLLMLGVTSDTLKRNVIDDLILMAGEENARYVDGVLTLFGRIIYCVGARDEGAEKRIRGLTVEGCYVDEATQIPMSVLKQARLRCSKGRGKLIFTTNPDSPFHPFYAEYINNEKEIKAGRLNIYSFTMDDNLALPEEYKDDVKASFTGVWYKRMVLGLWVVAEGLIYDGFSIERCGFSDDDTPADFDYIDIALDYGTQNAFVALLLGRKGDVTWVLDEYYYSGRDAQVQKTDAQYSADLINFTRGKKLKRIIYDPSAASFGIQMKSDGLEGLTTAENEVMDGIRTVATRLAQGKIKIHRSKCPNLVRELSSYSWDKKAAERGEDKPLKQHDHGPDALRYGEHTIYGKPSRKVKVYEGDIA